MGTLEIILLIVAYTLLTITLFVEVICYRRNLEKIETIFLTVSLFILIICLSATALFQLPDATQATHLSVQLAMILVSVSTPLNIMVERKHKLPNILKSIIIGIGIILGTFTVLSFFLNSLLYAQYIVASFLGISILFSMTLAILTKPQEQIIHRKKVERVFSIAFLTLIPLYLILIYTLEVPKTAIGFIIPLIFILLAANKLTDDLIRLSLFKPKVHSKEQHFKNYALTQREQEIADLLLQGKTYKEISEKLFIALPTVKTHVSNIYKKCGVKNRSALTALLTN